METIHTWTLSLSQAELDLLAKAVHFAFGDDEDAMLVDRDISPPVAHALRALLPLQVERPGPPPASPTPLDLPDWTHEGGRRFASQWATPDDPPAIEPPGDVEPKLTIVVENEVDVISATVEAEEDDMLALAQSIAGGEIVRVQVYRGERTIFLAAGAGAD